MGKYGYVSTILTQGSYLSLFSCLSTPDDDRWKQVNQYEMGAGYSEKKPSKVASHGSAKARKPGFKSRLVSYQLCSAVPNV